jgi:hypothetical protein
MHATGSAYLFRQVPGSERIGGLQLTVRPKRGPKGVITVSPTDWKTHNVHCQIDDFVERALAGIKEVAAKADLNLNDVDIELSHFLVHDVDSAPICYFQAAKSALRSALEMWSLKDLSA